MVEAVKIKRVMSVGELAIRIKKRWITRHSLVQQIDRLEAIRFPPGAYRQKNIFGARVKIERADVTRRTVHFQSGHLREVSHNLVLDAIGEKGVLLFLGQIAERKHCNAGLRRCHIREWRTL